MAVAGVLWLSPAGQPPAAAQRGSTADARAWYQAYSDALRAIGGRNWQAAVDSLLAAKRVGPRPGRNLPSYGDNIVEFYSPDYYLGVAYLNLGRFADAETAFQQARQAELIPPKDQAAFDTQFARASFERLLATAAEQVQAGRFEAARASVVQAKAFGIDNARASQMDDRVTQAETSAAEAAAVSRPTPTLTDAGSEQPVVNVLAPAAGTPPGYSRAPPRSAINPAPIRLPGEEKKLPVTTAEGGAGTGTESAGSRAASIERAAMAMFFSGDYGDAVAALTPLVNDPNRSAATAFYLACSNAALVLTGQADRDALDRARTLFVQSGGSGRVSEDRKYISPRILQLLEGRE
jgi:tetratricopeptide (TPR) repeat protein